MTIDPAALAAQCLKTWFDQQVANGTFPCVDGLRELRDCATHCRASSSWDRAVVAFVFEKVCHGWAYDLDERPVSRAEINGLRQKLLNPVVRAIDFLTGASDDPLLIAGDLVGAAP